MRSLHSQDNSLGSLQLSVDIFFLISYSVILTLLFNSEEKGLAPVHNSQISTPILQISTLQSCRCPLTIISGARQSNVPQQVHLLFLYEVKLDQPKSANLTSSSLPISIFSGLISRCIICFLWIYWIALATWYTYFAAWSQSNFLFGFFTNALKSYPFYAYQRTKQIEKSSQKWLYRLIMLGCLSSYMILTQLRTWSIKLWVLSVFFFIYLMAQMVPVFLCLPFQTNPQEPCPRLAKFQKSVLYDSVSHPACTVGERYMIRLVNLFNFISKLQKLLGNQYLFKDLKIMKSSQIQQFNKQTQYHSTTFIWAIDLFYALIFWWKQFIIYFEGVSRSQRRGTGENRLHLIDSSFGGRQFPCKQNIFQYFIIRKQSKISLLYCIASICIWSLTQYKCQLQYIFWLTTNPEQKRI